MNEFDPTELVAHVEEVIVGTWTDDVREKSLSTNTLDTGVLDQFRELGWFGLCGPEEDGGVGLCPDNLVSVFQRFGQSLVVGPLFEYMVAPSVLLRRLRGGSKMAAGVTSVLRAALTLDARLALADPTVSLSPDVSFGSVEATATGLDGAVSLVRGATDASHFLVRAHRQGAPIMALVPRGRAGVRVSAKPSADPGIDFAMVEFDDVVVESDDVLFDGAAAEDAWNDLRAWARTFLAAELAGIARHLHDLTVEYIQVRRQFGRPIGSFQALQHMAAENARRVVMLESLCAATASDARSAPERSRWSAAATLKALASEYTRLVCEDAMQMHGGIGFTQEYELQWYYKRALALQNWYGNERELAQAIGRARLSTATA